MGQGFGTHLGCWGPSLAVRATALATAALRTTPKGLGFQAASPGACWGATLAQRRALGARARHKTPRATGLGGDPGGEEAGAGRGSWRPRDGARRPLLLCPGGLSRPWGRRARPSRLSPDRRPGCQDDRPGRPEVATGAEPRARAPQRVLAVPPSRTPRGRGAGPCAVCVCAGLRGAGPAKLTLSPRTPALSSRHCRVGGPPGAPEGSGRVDALGRVSLQARPRGSGRAASTHHLRKTMAASTA